MLGLCLLVSQESGCQDFVSQLVRRVDARTLSLSQLGDWMLGLCLLVCRRVDARTLSLSYFGEWMLGLCLLVSRRVDARTLSLSQLGDWMLGLCLLVSQESGCQDFVSQLVRRVDATTLSLSRRVDARTLSLSQLGVLLHLISTKIV